MAAVDRDVVYPFRAEEGRLKWPVGFLQSVEANGSTMKGSAGQTSTHERFRTLAALRASM